MERKIVYRNENSFWKQKQFVKIEMVNGNRNSLQKLKQLWKKQQFMKIEIVYGNKNSLRK